MTACSSAYPSDRVAGSELTMGTGARLRSGTVIYAGSTFGQRLHDRAQRRDPENTYIGDDVSIWSNSVIDYGCVIGDRVKIHSNCYVAQFTELEDDVFLAPGVTIANDLYPGNEDSAEAMAGPLFARGAQIGVNVTHPSLCHHRTRARSSAPAPSSPATSRTECRLRQPCGRRATRARRSQCCDASRNSAHRTVQPLQRSASPEKP